MGVQRSSVVAGVAALAVAVAGYAAADVADVVPGVLTRADRVEAAATPTPPTPPPMTTSPGGGTGPVTGPLAALDPRAPVPSTSGLAAALTPLLAAPALGPSVGLDVRDGLTGQALFSVDAGRPRTVASTTKLLTAAAVMHAADGARTFDTRTVVGARPGEVVLVAGGDMLLAPGKGDPRVVAGRAGIADLAARTAEALRRSGVTRVRLMLDDSYARGPALAPAWAPADVAAGLTGPVTMLGTTDIRALHGRPAPTDPAMATAQTFATALTAAGVPVTGRVGRADAPAGATQLAVVHSAPLVEVLAHALDESDNALTESLARSAAFDDGLTSPTFPEVAGWVRSRLADQGIDVADVTLLDASGLSRGAGVPVSVIADVLTRGATGSEPRFADVVARLPVAGLTGTLTRRFGDRNSASAAGLARAKTGTLTGVGSLGGTVVDRDGRLLTYAVVADRAGGTLPARDALDHLVATLAACGCR